MEPNRIELGRAMLLAGLRRHHEYATAAHTVPAQWRDFMAAAPLPGRVDGVTYGAMCGAADGRFEYMCAVEVSDFAGLPDGTGRMRVPEQQYAVFVHDGPASGIPRTWDAALRRWLPRSEYVDAQTPAFERYDARFNPATASGLVEIWLPIALRR